MNMEGKDTANILYQSKVRFMAPMKLLQIYLYSYLFLDFLIKLKKRKKEKFNPETSKKSNFKIRFPRRG